MPQRSDLLDEGPTAAGDAGFRHSTITARLWGGGSADYGPESLEWWTDGPGPSSLYGAGLF